MYLQSSPTLASMQSYFNRSRYHHALTYGFITVRLFIVICCCRLRCSHGNYQRIINLHSGETDEANCSWLHPVWPPPKRRDQDSTFCMVSRASTELIFCIHRDFDVRNNVCKPYRLVCEYCRDISACNCGWWSQLYFAMRVGWSQLSTGMKPIDSRTGLMKPTAYNSVALAGALETDYARNGWI